MFIRVTPEEKSAIQERARSHSRKASDFIREAGLHGRVQLVLSINLAQWGKLGGLAANLNQLTRHANAGVISPDLASAILETKAMVDAIRQDLVTKRGAQA